MTDPARTLALTQRHETSASNTFRLVDDPPVFIRGEGAFLYTADGEAFLDLVCGSATSSLGHDHPAHRAALLAAIHTGILHTGTRLPSPFRAGLYERLAAILPKQLDTFLLANSGAEAVEAAIKAAQFATGSKALIAFAGGYHGRTLGALSVTDGQRITRPFSRLPEVTRIHFPLSANETEAALTELEAALTTQPVAAVIVEAVQAVSGLREAPQGFLLSVHALCRRHGALLIIDEIWNGLGRCGTMFGFERHNIVPDLVTFGKGLSASLPLSGVAGSGAVLKAWPPVCIPAHFRAIRSVAPPPVQPSTPSRMAGCLKGSTA